MWEFHAEARKIWANQEVSVTLGPPLFKEKASRRMKPASRQHESFLVPVPFDLQLVHTRHPADVPLCTGHLGEPSTCTPGSR